MIKIASGPKVSGGWTEVALESVLLDGSDAI
jgi:hypothetical protein